MSEEDRVNEEVRSLAAMDISQLRDAWRRRYGPPPRFRSTDLLARLLAWKIQADAFGGFDKRTIRMITAERPGPPPVKLQPGTRLAREHQGVRHEVEVIDGGFRYHSATYRSLSEIARQITGTRWNGLVFFGLRERTQA